MKRSLLIFTCILLLVTSAGAMKVKSLLSYQGRLTDDTGVPLSGSYDITFRIYDSETGGSLLWEESHSSVPVSDGLFSVVLGTIEDITPEDLADPNETVPELVRYLEIQVGTSTALTPRVPLVASPYAIASYRVAGDIITKNSQIEIFSADMCATGDSCDFGLFLQDSASLSAYQAQAEMVVRKRPGRVKYSNITLKSHDASTGATLEGFSLESDHGVTDMQLHAFEEGATVPLQSYRLVVDTAGSGLHFLSGTDSAVVVEAKSDKRKQSLYFPESATAGIDMTVDASGSRLTLASQSPLGGPDPNVVINGDGNMTLDGTLDMSNSPGALIVPRLSTSQRDALSPINGMIIYNTTTNQFNFYENNAWVTK
jgi:hypothetical protein